MKITKEQLQKIVKEELSEALKEGEIDEGFLDRLLGRSSEFSDLVSGDRELKTKIVKVQNSLKDIARTARMQQNNKLEQLASDLSSKVADMSSLTVPAGTGVVTAPKADVQQAVKRIDMSKPGFETFKNFRDSLKTKITSKTPKELALMHNKLVPDSEKIDPDLQTRREEAELKKYKGQTNVRPDYKYRKELAQNVLKLLDQALIDPKQYTGTQRRERPTPPAGPKVGAGIFEDQ